MRHPYLGAARRPASRVLPSSMSGSNLLKSRLSKHLLPVCPGRPVCGSFDDEASKVTHGRCNLRSLLRPVAAGTPFHPLCECRSRCHAFV